MALMACRCVCSSTAAAAAATTAPPSAPGSGVAPGLQAAANFPLLQREVHSRRLVYLDNAASSQKPQAVLDAMAAFYSEINSNVHRGVHSLAAQATDAYERARVQVADFVNASSPSEIVWARNASEAINLVAYSWGLENLKPGDEIISSVLEHHSNLVPWQMIAKKTGAKLRFVGLNENQEFDIEQFKGMVNSKTKLIALAHVSNVLASELPVSTVVEAAKSVGARILLDACQSVPHMPVDVQQLGVDWIVASGHKMCGPTGIGFLWGKLDLLEEMPPFLGGGEMIMNVELEESTYAEPPLKFEAGTPAIGEAIGLGAACEYLSNMGMDKIHAYEQELGDYLYENLSAVEGVTVYGPKKGRAALAAFNTSATHATDIATIIDHSGVAIRSGHHCTQPLHKYLGIPASARASLYLYNTKEEVDEFIKALDESIKFFAEIGAQ